MSATLRAIGLPNKEAIAYFAQKVNVPSQRYTDVWKAGHAHGFMVAGAASDALLADFRAAITQAIGGQTTLHDFRAQFRGIVAKHGWEHNGEPGWRARVIYETNVAMAQSAGEYAHLTDPDTLAVFPYWQYVHSGSKHPRQQHLAWNGKILRADDPWWRTHFPPNGWRCGCRVRPVSGRDMQRMGRTGPDPAPPIVTRPWTNPSTGQVEHVPVGIDPGFDYNPGLAWTKAEPRVAQQVRWAEQVPPPPPAPALPPAPPRLASPVRFASVTEANKQMEGWFQPWAARLTTDEAQALGDYKGGMGRDLNAALRGVPFPGWEEMNQHLRAALGRAEMPETIRVFRGLSEVELAAYQTMAPGTVVQAGKFTSTTISPGVALGYGQPAEIIIPAGTRGAAYVHPFPRYRYRQYEVLLHPDARFRVVATQPRLVLRLVAGA